MIIFTDKPRLGRLATLSTAVLCGIAAPAAAATPTAREIVAKAHCVSYSQGDDAAGRISLEIVDSQGRKQEREISMMRRDDGSSCEAKQSFYAYFRRPSDVREMRFLVLKDPGKADNRWLYLPALDLVKRISSADKRTSFAGSHLLYEDVSGRHVDDDTHRLVETTDQYYVTESRPKSQKGVEFKYFKMWIHKKTFVTVKTEFYDLEGKKYRTFETKKVEMISGFPTAVHVRVTDLKMHGTTDKRVSGIKYNIGLPADIFGERSLRNVPRKYLQ